MALRSAIVSVLVALALVPPAAAASVGQSGDRVEQVAIQLAEGMFPGNPCAGRYEIRYLDEAELAPYEAQYGHKLDGLAPRGAGCLVLIEKTLPDGYRCEVIAHEIGHRAGFPHVEGHPLMEEGLTRPPWDPCRQAFPPVAKRLTRDLAEIALAESVGDWLYPGFVYCERRSPTRFGCDITKRHRVRVARSRRHRGGKRYRWRSETRHYVVDANAWRPHQPVVTWLRAKDVRVVLPPLSVA